MKVLKFVLYAFIECIILIMVFFVSPTIVKSFKGNMVVWIYIFLGITVFSEYLFLFLRKKGRYFTVPLSIVFLLAVVMFYFNSPDNTNPIWAVKAIFKNFMLPIGIVSVSAAAGLHIIDRVNMRNTDEEGKNDSY